MRTRSIIVTLTCLSLTTLLGACASQPSTDRALASDAWAPKDARADITPIGAPGAVLRVNGMSCPKCANNIERQMSAVAGVQDIAIDLGAGVVSLAFAPDATHPSPADLASAIDRTGFTLVSVSPGGDR